MRAAAVSAPGKAILMGEHAAVHGRPALVAALSLRTTARVVAAEAGRVRLELPAVGFAGAMPWDEVDHLTLEAREAWVRASRGAAAPALPS